MSAALPPAHDRAMVAAPHGDSETAPTQSAPTNPTVAGRRRLSPSELHAQRVEWGRLWGARISEATKRWKGVL